MVPHRGLHLGRSSIDLRVVMSMLRISMATLLIFLSVTIEAASHTGSISGVVLDSADKPLANATVYAVEKTDMRHQIRVKSDSLGHFVLNDLSTGSVFVDAYKETDGYPYNFFSFFKAPGSNTPMEIEVAPGKLSTGLVLRLGARAATLRLDIANEEGSPLSGTISFVRPDLPGPYKRGVNSGDEILVPPVPFRLTFDAPGYLSWHYGGNGWLGKDGLMTLKSGETLTITIRARHSSRQ